MAASSFGTRLKALRESHDMSQHALANEIGCNPTTVFCWEKGRQEPSVRMLDRLARLFGVNFEWLAVGRGTKSKVRPNPEQLKAQA